MGDQSWIEVTTVGDLLLAAAEEWPDRDALVFPDRRVKYRELSDRAITVAGGLLNLGVRRGDAIGILMPNCVEFAECFFGATLIGAVAVPINARFKRRELTYVFENADLVALLTSDIIDEHVDFVELITESLPGLAESTDPRHLEVALAPRLRAVVMMGTKASPGFLSAREFLTDPAPTSEVLELRGRLSVAEAALMPYTSGTTAYPKGCVLTHEGLVRDWIATGRRFDVRPGDRVWDPLPLFHLAGLGPLLFTLQVGGTFISSVHFDADQSLDQIVAEKATHLYPSFPALTMALLTHPRVDASTFASVRAMLNVAPPETMTVMQKLLPRVTQVNSYGLTESSGISAVSSVLESDAVRAETCGKPLPGVEVKIIDPESGEELPQGSHGEILIRGYNVTQGYYRDPEKTAATIDPERWLHTGDLGTVDPEGRIIYVGRAKDMLKVGGENVAPSEIEAHLSTHPAVRLAQVVGVADPKYGEVPVAFVELLVGRIASAEELIEFCHGEIANFKIPRAVHFLDSSAWPMSATKVQKFRLREWAAAGRPAPPA